MRRLNLRGPETLREAERFLWHAMGHVQEYVIEHLQNYSVEDNAQVLAIYEACELMRDAIQQLQIETDS